MKIGLRKAVQSFVRQVDAEYVQAEDKSEKEKEFYVSFYNLTFVEKIRDLKSVKIGRLVSITGTVTRTSEVRPELMYGKFTCQECGTPSEAIEQQFKFTEPPCCQNPLCEKHCLVKAGFFRICSHLHR